MRQRVLALTLLLLLAPSLPIAADEAAADGEPAVESDVAPGAPPPFQPPLMGAPAGRVSAATRGDLRLDGILAIVAPAGGGLTASGQPVLTWHLAEATEAALRLEIVANGTTEPWLVWRDDDGLEAGFHRLDLGSLGLRLPAGKIFLLRLTLESPDGSATASVESYLERVAADAAVEAALAAPADDPTALATLAAAGLWWDYIDRLATAWPKADLIDVARKQALLLP